MKLVSRDYLFLIYKLFQALYQAPERKKPKTLKNLLQNIFITYYYIYVMFVVLKVHSVLLFVASLFV